MNWFDGLKPGLGPFDAILSTPLRMFLALVWAVAFFFCAFHLVVGVARLAAAKQAHRPVDFSESGSGVVWPLIGIVALAMLPALFNAALGR
ncbi:MAG: hypothetical protein Q4G45_09870 [Actinomycetia bacterium]|nr:hypothetical protein [Actinomycetes bacterium]